MTAQLARMTQVLIVSPGTMNGRTTTKLHQSITTKMAKATVPSGAGRSGGESSWQNIRRRRRSGCRKSKGVKGPRAGQGRQGPAGRWERAAAW